MTELSIRLAMEAADRGKRPLASISVDGEPGTELTFGRSSDCDLVIPVADYFSRVHGRFYFEGRQWRVRREGSSELRMWFDFGVPGVLTCHGPGSDLRLPVSQGTITFRPPGTRDDVRLEWVCAGDIPADDARHGNGGKNVTKALPPALHPPVDSLSPRFVAFLLVLCHRPLLKLDYTAPSINELALWSSRKRGIPLETSTIRGDYQAKLRGMLQNLAGSRTFSQRERTDARRQHPELAVMAQDIMDMRILSCDLLIDHIRGGQLPNFPDLGWLEGQRG